MFSGDKELFLVAESRLEETYGPIDYHSSTLPFTHTSYYTPEFGLALSRKFVAFERLIDPSNLADIKHVTNALEHELAVDGKRCINLDPGYISQSKLVLATTKNHSHRIYLDKGIYAEVTLRYQHKAFRTLEWTYPDYRTEEYLEILREIRQSYVEQLRTENTPHSSDAKNEVSTCTVNTN